MQVTAAFEVAVTFYCRYPLLEDDDGHPLTVTNCTKPIAHWVLLSPYVTVTSRRACPFSDCHLRSLYRDRDRLVYNLQHVRRSRPCAYPLAPNELSSL